MGGKVPRSALKEALGNPPDFHERLDIAVSKGFVEIMAGITKGDVPCVFVVFKKDPLPALREEEDLYDDVY